MANKKTGDAPASGPDAPSPPSRGAPVAVLGLAALVLLALLGGGLLLAGNLSSIGKGCLGVVHVSGELVTEDSQDGVLSSGAAGSETMAKTIEGAQERPDVRALLVIIDSPGGSAVASREIYEALKEVKKPKVAYLREVAASGGYYVAMGSDYIVSDPEALTGNIGVRATFLDFSGLMQKIGVNETSVKSGEVKDIGSPFRPMTPKERAIWDALINESFGEFKNVVMESRGTRLNRAAFGTVLDGRVVSGRQAAAIGMVDETGNKKRAIKKASELAGEKEDLPLCEMEEKQRGLLGRLLAQTLGGVLPQRNGGGWRLVYQ